MEIEKILKSICNDLINKVKYDTELKKIYNLTNEPINWNNVNCECVEKRYCIYLQEVSPDADNLKKYLLSQLQKYGFDISQIEIITEY